jgi:hypothetical protein
MSIFGLSKAAYTVEEFAKEQPLGRTSLYKAIKDGKLIARKSGKSTIILAEDAAAFLKSLPIVEHNSKAA